MLQEKSKSVLVIKKYFPISKGNLAWAGIFGITLLVHCANHLISKLINSTL